MSNELMDRLGLPEGMGEPVGGEVRIGHKLVRVVRAALPLDRARVAFLGKELEGLGNQGFELSALAPAPYGFEMTLERWA